MSAPMQADQSTLWTFPLTFVGHRRRLPPDSDLFESSTLQHEETPHTVSRIALFDHSHQASRGDSFVAPLGNTADRSAYLCPTFECAACHVSLPTAHLLDIHVAEAHDSFFAAQAARRMPVYACLVESCGRKFTTIEERKQHLVDHHRFSKDYHFDRIHLRRRMGQIRPLSSSATAKQRSKKEGDVHQDVEGGCVDSTASQSVSDVAGGGDGICAIANADKDASTERHDDTLEEEQMIDMKSSDLSEGFSRLSMAAETSSVPANIAFGRRRGGRGMSRGRGRGRQQARSSMET